MIDTLSDRDWDTQGESVEAFKDNSYVVKAFETRGYRLPERLFTRLEPQVPEMMEQFLQNITQGEWRAQGRNLYVRDSDDPEPTYWVYCDGMSDTDVRFVAYTHRTAPLLLEEIRRLKARLWEKWADDDNQ